MSIDAQANLRSLRDVLRFAVTRFNESNLFFGHGQVDAYDEAVFLVMRALHLPLERLEVFLDAYLTLAELNHLIQLIDLRVKKRIPAAYLLKEAWLQGYRFAVDERVIIPRSFIAELLTDGLQPWISDPDHVTDVLDLCTGSGCLAILAADLFPNAQVDAVDLSKDALDVAKMNIRDYGLEDRVHPIESDLFSALSDKRYDVIFTNPPYVTTDAMRRLPLEYQHEPQLALAAGTDGMDIVRKILKTARTHLNPNGLLFVEVGDGRETVEHSFPELSLTWLATSAGDDMVFMAQQDELP